MIQVSLTFMQHRPAFVQRGLSLIELMVVLVLGAVLSLAAVRVLSNNVTMVKHTRDLSQTLEHGTYALAIISRHIRQSGYNNYFDSSLSNNNSLPVRIKDVNGCTADDTCGTNSNTDSDQLVLRYDINTTYTNNWLVRTCNGGEITQANIGNANISRRVVEVFAVDDNTNQLVCSSYTESDGGVLTPLFNNNNTVALINGVLQMQVQYGVASSNSNVAQRFLNATEVANATGIAVGRDLKAIRIALLIRPQERSNTDPTPATANTNLFTLLDANPIQASALANGEDSANYRIYEATYALNNAGGNL